MARFVALLADGVSLGSILALTALGFLVLHKATGVINFAQGDFVTLGAYFGVWATTDLGLPAIPGYLVAIAAMFLVGIVLERIAYAPLRRRPPVVLLLATLGAGIVIRAAIGLWQGTLPVTLKTPAGLQVAHLFGAAIPYQRIVIVVVTLVVIAGLLFLFSSTQFGRQLRALAADRATAQLQGIRTTRMSMLAFGISSALSALAGVLVGPLTPIDPNFGFNIMLSAFAAAILGGFGSLVGVVVAGMFIGIIEQTLGGYVLQNWNDAFPYIAMLLVLAFRPQGLFSTPERARL